MRHGTSPIGKDIQDGGYELPRILLPRTPVNSARTRGEHRRDVSHVIEVEANYRGPKRRRRYNAFPDPPTKTERMGVGREPNHEREHERADQGAACRRPHHVQGGPGKHTRLLRGMEVVAEVPNDGEVLKLAHELSPDVVIMQVQMPFERAKQTLKAMRSFPDPPKVVIVTMFESPQYVRGLSGVGASAYLLKSSSSEHLVAA